MKSKVMNHRDLEVYRRSFDAAMALFEHSKSFSAEERYSLTDQLRRSSRSVCANLAEAWRKRRYEAAFVSKLSDAEAEVAETQVWLEFAVRCRYLKADDVRQLYRAYNMILRTIIGMMNRPETWTITRATKSVGS